MPIVSSPTENSEEPKKGMEIVCKEESYRIIGACFEVYKEKGNEFLEAVYQECLAIEFTEQGIPFVEHERFVNQSSPIAFGEDLSRLSPACACTRADRRVS